jgi:hypothetical protein
MFREHTIISILRTFRLPGFDFQLIDEDECRWSYLIYTFSQGKGSIAFGDQRDLIVITSGGGDIFFTGIGGAGMYSEAAFGWYFRCGRRFYGYLQEVVTNAFQPYTLDSSAIIIGGHIFKVNKKDVRLCYY